MCQAWTYRQPEKQVNGSTYLRKDIGCLFWTRQERQGEDCGASSCHVIVVCCVGVNLVAPENTYKNLHFPLRLLELNL